VSGGKGIYIVATLVSISISLAPYFQASARRRSSWGCGRLPFSTWAKASWRKTSSNNPPTSVSPCRRTLQNRLI
jgi:hypothetical protein